MEVEEEEVQGDGGENEDRRFSIKEDRNIYSQS